MNTSFDETLQELSMKTLRKEKVLWECRVLEERYNALKVQADELEKIRDKESEEARKADESFFLSHFAKGKVNKEEVEAYVAQEKYEVSCKELELLGEKQRELKELIVESELLSVNATDFLWHLSYNHFKQSTSKDLLKVF